VLEGRYAVRLVDLMGAENFYRLLLVRPVWGPTIEGGGPDLDGMTVVLLDCPEDRARAILHFLLKDKGRKGPTRCYHREQGRWVAVKRVDS